MTVQLYEIDGADAILTRQGWTIHQKAMVYDLADGLIGISIIDAAAAELLARGVFINAIPLAGFIAGGDTIPIVEINPIAVTSNTVEFRITYQQ